MQKTLCAPTFCTDLSLSVRKILPMALKAGNQLAVAINFSKIQVFVKKKNITHEFEGSQPIGGCNKIYLGTRRGSH